MRHSASPVFMRSGEDSGSFSTSRRLSIGVLMPHHGCTRAPNTFGCLRSWRTRDFSSLPAALRNPSLRRKCRCGVSFGSVDRSNPPPGMQTLAAILSVAALAAALWGYFKWLEALNRRSRSKYGGFEPVNGWSVALATTYIICLLAGLMLVANDGGIPSWPWPEGFIYSKAGNGVVLICVGVLIALGQFAWIWHQASFLTALGASFILFVAGFFFFTVILFIALVICLILEDKQSKRPRRY